LGSFKFRLVSYFLLLSLLPLLAASWVFSEVASRSELGRTDSRLNAALRVAAAAYSEEIAEGADATARELAHKENVQRALHSRNRGVLFRIARETPNTAFFGRGQLLAGEVPSGLAAERTAQVVTESGEVIGEITSWLPLNDELVNRLRARAGMEGEDWLVIANDGRVVAGPPDISGTVEPVDDRPAYLTLGESEYRAVSTPIFSGTGSATLMALVPRDTIDSAVQDLRERFLVFALIALAVVALLAYTLGRTIVSALKALSEGAGAIARGQFERRVSVRGRDEFAALGRAFNDMAAQLETRRQELAEERMRVQDAIARFGDALAATHDPYALLPVIVESAVEATGAIGGRLVVEGNELARAGEPSAAGGPELEIPLESGSEQALLILAPAGAEFAPESRELASWLGSQAAVALENARLHRLVERQAVTDGLTELANRRQFEQALAGEISRAERFGGMLALILADLDDFKQVNDRYGHQAGDEVLRQFAAVLRETVRDVDLPARYGGEEFAVLLPQTDLEGAERLAERLRQAVAERPMTKRPGALVAVTASFGVASFPEASTPAALFAAADEALYRAKAAGKNRVVCAEPDGAVRASQQQGHPRDSVHGDGGVF
jgi:diguanylate cyclase (GGDEF)-like protein